MPSTEFICPNGWYIQSKRARVAVPYRSRKISIEDCLAFRGCQMWHRCATLPYLRMIGYDREWRGVTPSAAGTGPRLLYLKATTDFAIDPNDRAFAALGVGVHGKLSIHKYTYNVLAEEELSDEESRGIADVLEMDEEKPGWYILDDYKTYGSFKTKKAMGLVTKKRKILDVNGNPVLKKTGKNKGDPKTKSVIELRPNEADLRSETLQLNRYRIFFNRQGFPISRIQLQIIVRDGGLYSTKNQGIERNIYIIRVPFLPDKEVLDFYRGLQIEVDEAFRTGWVRRCNNWESWGGRRCDGYCEVKNVCMEMDQTKMLNSAKRSVG